jgi:triacylglycerol lipase
MIPFNGQFAEETMLQLATVAYDSVNAPKKYTRDQRVFALSSYDILADAGHPAIQAQLSSSGAVQNPQGSKVLRSMMKQPKQQQGTTMDAQVRALNPAPTPNLHFGWFCLDSANKSIVLAFRGTEYLHDWLDDFDFIPAPYAPVPGRGTVHQGFQLAYLAIRDNLMKLLNQHAAGFQEILITGHSLGAALCALATLDILNLNPNLSPVVYTWAEPRVGHDDFVNFFNTHVNICYRVVNLWDVVPHLPPSIASYEHEGNQVTIDSGFSLDVVHNHVLPTGYVPGMKRWNHDHPPQDTQHLGRMALAAMVGQSK